MDTYRADLECCSLSQPLGLHGCVMCKFLQRRGSSAIFGNEISFHVLVHVCRLAFLVLAALERLKWITWEPVRGSLRWGCGESAGDLFTPAEKSVSQRAIDHLMGWRVLGQRHKEHILPVGATITAIGELAASSADGAACKGAIPLGSGGSVLVLQVSARKAPPPPRTSALLALKSN